MHKNSKSKTHYYYYFYRIGHIVTAVLLWSYYNFLLLRTEENLIDAVPVVFQSHGMLYLGLFLGYILGAYALTNVGYRETYRLSSIFSIVAILIVIFNVDNIIDVYLFVSLIRGIGAGLYWISSNNYMLREQHGKTRGRSISIIFSMQYLLEILVPVMGGFIITYLDYESLFIIGMAVEAFIILFPQSENSTPKEKLSRSELTGFFSKRGFKRLTGILFITEILTNARSIIFAFLPFLLLGDELSAGLFMSAVGVVAVIIAYFRRNSDTKVNLKLGYYGAWLVAVLTAGLSILWTVPALFIRNSLAKLGFSVWAPVHLDLQNQVQELFLGSHLNESALEMTLYRETVLMLARITNMIIFMFIFYVVDVDIEFVLRLIIFITIFREIIFLSGFENLRKMFMIGSSNLAYQK